MITEGPRRAGRRVLLLLLATGLMALVWAARQRARLPFEPNRAAGIAVTNGAGAQPRRPGWLEVREQQVAGTVWAKEVLAQECGKTFEALWERILVATNKLAVVAAFDPGEVILGRWAATDALDDPGRTVGGDRDRGTGIQPGQGRADPTPARPEPRPTDAAAIRPQGIAIYTSSGPGEVLRSGAWRDWVSQIAGHGWELTQVELRHNRFDTDDAGRPRQSVFYFAAHAIRPSPPTRAIIEGDLVVDWKSGPTHRRLATVSRVDASRLVVRARRGSPPFECVLRERVAPPAERVSVDPLILHDLDGDRRSEILLPSVNAVFRRDIVGRYRREVLCRFPPGKIFTAIMADFDGDGASDLLCARAEGLVLYQGRAGAVEFGEPERLAWLASEPLRNPMALTCGDVDCDGDLDLFLGQYRAPTMGSVLKPWYYDANDGYPAHLLLNDGTGRFTDGTVAAGLTTKRGRRTYTASLVDLDDDGDLDLLVVSDFAGLDLYRNDGRGHFTDATAAWVADPKAFGMAHALADFNADGRLDLLMIGMNSPTVDRLEHLGLRRPGSLEDFAMRPRMAFGNRLYLARAAGGFEQTRFNDAMARSGWSWGCSAADFDDDGFPDVYIANGLQSQASVRDFEPEFWLHDIYVDETVDDQEATRYFMDKFARTRGQGWSYGGHERNRLYFNRGGRSFVEAAFLMGVSLTEDSRNVVTDDLDGDGRMDLVVTTFEVWPEVQQTLRVYLNRLGDGGHWVGFHFPERPGTPSVIGTAVIVNAGGRRAVRHVVTGDSHRAQHAPALHFGLGTATNVDGVEVRWPDGTRAHFSGLEADRYHGLDWTRP